MQLLCDGGGRLPTREVGPIDLCDLLQPLVVDGHSLARASLRAGVLRSHLFSCAPNFIDARPKLVLLGRLVSGPGDQKDAFLREARKRQAS